MTPLSDLRRTARLALLLRLRAGRFVALTHRCGGVAHATGAAIYATVCEEHTRAVNELSAAIAAEGNAS